MHIELPQNLTIGLVTAIRNGSLTVLVAIERSRQAEDRVAKQTKAGIQCMAAQADALNQVARHFNTAASHQIFTCVGNTYVVFEGNEREFSGDRFVQTARRRQIMVRAYPGRLLRTTAC